MQRSRAGPIDTVWTMSQTPCAGGVRLRPAERGRALRFYRYFRLLADNPHFADWYTEQLATAGFEAYFWEHPPLTRQALQHEAQLVLIDAPSLADVTADPSPFRNQFDHAPAADKVITFRNLGGDAELVVPRPVEGNPGWGHLAAYLRRARPEQARRLWRVAARTVQERVGQAPLWLSTSGLGVYWLHLRLDSVPKYYQFKPYRDADG